MAPDALSAATSAAAALASSSADAAASLAALPEEQRALLYERVGDYATAHSLQSDTLLSAGDDYCMRVWLG